MASRSVTDASIASSAGPATSGATSSRRSVRSGRASLGRSIDPTRPAAPVITMTDTCVSAPFSVRAGQVREFRPGSQTGTSWRPHLFYQRIRIVGSYSDGLYTGFLDAAKDERPPPGDHRSRAHHGGGSRACHRAGHVRRAGAAACRPRGPDQRERHHDGDDRPGHRRPGRPVQRHPAAPDLRGARRRAVRLLRGRVVRPAGVRAGLAARLPGQRGQHADRRGRFARRRQRARDARVRPLAGRPGPGPQPRPRPRSAGGRFRRRCRPPPPR